ncbi:phosphoserine phosphatase [Uncinocarpus reesii 1704]|uniref:phosphoserine phosphatase n=1 Tax=Uncinocarpus reesii (strain UAMH 1704) TaxID=336963 RepID=C4JE76_UNCRE|nr:phosphoserine phosphatase [Uncinocarpus reesii 1704]EEP75654.1 phosphoserine phosphatase [Uncinocarpus reesii 1704]
MEELSTPYHRMSSSHRCLDREDHPRVVEVTICPPPSPEYLTFTDMRKHECIWRFEREWNVEVVLQQESVFRRHKRLAVFDMDSTLIKQEVIDEIARFIGVEKEVSEITARAMNGELDFSASLKARVSLLKGVPADVFEKLKSIITIAPGARELCRALKRLGFKMAVLSGGFQPLAEWLAEELSLDYAFANHVG